jgi:imidazolonepropionase-like amidohydrolase
MLDELKRIQLHNPQIPIAEMLTWITSNGARALQMEDKLGSIEKGKKPGLVLIENCSNENDITNAVSQRII